MDHTMRSSSVRLILGASIATLLLFGVVHPTHAGLQDDPPSTTVRFADLNLQNEEGLKTLYERIRHAAHLVCDKAISDTDITSQREWWRCYRNTVDHTVAQLNNSRLTAMYTHGKRKNPG